MTDSPGLPPEEERVRRLLADARHDGPTPPEVVARLDETLAALVSERGDAPLEGAVHPTPVVDLGVRRRRMAGVGLLAAAAVVVAGVAIGQALPRMQGGDEASTSGGVAAESDASEREFGGQSDDGGADAGGGSAEESPGSMKSQGPAPLAGAPTLSTSDADLDDRLTELRSSTADTVMSQRRELLDLVRACDLRGIGEGRRLVVRVDGQDGLVLFRRPDGAAQQAEVYVCGTPEPVRTLTLPAP
jgi:hypothetical protein